jgi:hypothetical protein
MPERRISILIDTKGDVRGIDQVTGALGRMEGQSDALFGALKAGIAIDIGGRLVGSIGQIPAVFDRAIERGVQFNAVLETSALGIAAVMKQFDTAGRFKTFDDAMAASATAIDLLKQKAKESPATFQSLVQAYQALSGPLTAANIPMEKQVELIVNMSQALSGLGISSQQLLQETRALVTGNINADAAAAKILGVTAADITGAKQRGELYEFLSGKISAFAEAGKRGASTYQTAVSNLDDAIDDVLAKVTKPIFEALTKGTLDLSAALNDPEIVQSLSDIGEGIASLVKSGYELTTWAIENRDALLLLAKAAGALGVAYAAVNITNLLVGLGLKVAAVIRSTAAIEAETAALARNTAAQLANGAARTVGGAVGGSGGAGYGKAIGGAVVGTTTSIAAQAALNRATNLGEYAKPSTVRAAYAGRVAGAVAPEAAATGVTAAGVATVAASLVIAALAGWFIRAQILATAAARDRRTNEQGDRYTADTVGNIKAMNAMVTGADKLAVLERLRTQEAKVQQDIYDAIGQGDAVRLDSSRQQLKFIELQRSQVDGIFERVHAINGVEADRLRLLKETEAFVKKSLAERDELAKGLPDARRAYDDQQFRTGDDRTKLDILDKRRAALPSDLALGTAWASTYDMAAGKERDAAQASLLEKYRQVKEIAEQRAEIEQSIAGKLADQAAELAKQSLARADYVVEVQIAEARARGLDQVADRLENEKKLREEIRRVVEATGASEAEAEAAARRKLSAEWQLEQKKSGPSANQGSGFKPPVSQPKTVSPFDSRAVGRLHLADPVTGRVPLAVPAPSFAAVVPQVNRPGTAGNPPAGNLAGALASAADAVKADPSAANLAALSKSLAEFGAITGARNAKVDAAYKSLLDQVETLKKQMAAGRARS